MVLGTPTREWRCALDVPMALSPWKARWVEVASACLRTTVTPQLGYIQCSAELLLGLLHNSQCIHKGGYEGSSQIGVFHCLSEGYPGFQFAYLC